MAGGMEEVDVRVGDEIVTIHVPMGMPDEEIKQRVRSQKQTPPVSTSSSRIGTDVKAYLANLEQGQLTGPFTGQGGETFESISKMVRPAVLPIAAGIGAAAAAPTLGIPTLIALMAGGILGEGTNQRLGITEPSGTQIALAGISDPAFRGLGAAYQGGRRLLSRILPGAGASRRTGAVETAQGLAGSLRPPTKSEELFTELRELNELVPLEPIRNAARPLATSDSLLRKHVESAVRDIVPYQGAQYRLTNLQNELKSLQRQDTMGPYSQQTKKEIMELEHKISEIKQGKNLTLETSISPNIQASVIDPLANVRGIAAQLSNLTSDIHGVDAVPFKRVWATMKELNDLIDGAKRQGGAELSGLLLLKRGMWEALERASEQESGKAHMLLKQANKAYRQEIASDAVDDVINKNFGRALEGTELLSSRAAPAINRLNDLVREDEFLKASFPPGEFERIIKTLEEIKTLPVRGAPAGAERGFGLMGRQATIGGSIGTAVGAMMGGGTGATIGLAIGTGGSVAGAMIISKGLQTSRGREMLIRMAKSPGGLDYPKLGVLGRFLAAQAAETKEFQDNIKSALKDEGKKLEEKVEIATDKAEKEKVLKQIEQQFPKKSPRFLNAW